jgi:catechol 2,3-dioxygenase-like lactoylglutathione lyase family enzyme
MIAYVTIGATDYEKSKAFYLAVLEDLGASVVMDTGRLAAIGMAGGGPMLGVCAPYNEEAPAPGNGNMVAITPGSKELVAKIYAKAIELGASDEGEPGQRADGFYGAYFRDTDGNKICLAEFS